MSREGIEGLGMQAGSGSKPRLTEQERSCILALVKQPPPGRLERQADETLEARDEEGSAQWSLDALTEAAHAAGIQVERSQIRRISVREGVRWRHTHSWGTSDDKDFVRNPNSGRHSLHRATRGVDDRLYRRIRASDPTHVCTRSQLVFQWPSYQSSPGLEPWRGENLDLWGFTGPRWQRVDQMCRLAQFQELH